MNKKVISIVLSLCMVLSCLSIGGINAFAVTTDSAFSQAEESAGESSANSYGLTDTCQDGVILHAWNWSFNNIKAQMKTIAECGYTSVQTSPVQIAKENTKNVSVGNWWVFYQPAGFSIDNTGGSALGTKSEFKAMCDEAHKYGIHVIVDIVANHLGNNGAWNTLAPRAYQYEQQIANNWLFHNEGNCNDGNAYNVVKGQIGMPDLQTENSVVQQRVLSLLKECIDCGADGFRFDAAKHIETPDDGSNGSQFWPTVINGAKSYYSSKGTYNDLYNYGEILNTCGGGRSYGSYTKYISVTDNTTGSGKISIRDVTNVQNYLAHDYTNCGNVGKYAESDTLTVYFENTENWSTPYIHYWNNDETTQWPGEKMTLVSSNIYAYEVPKTMTGVIFNNGNGTRTKDFTMPTKSNMLYSYSSGSWTEYK